MNFSLKNTEKAKNHGLPGLFGFYNLYVIGKSINQI